MGVLSPGVQNLLGQLNFFCYRNHLIPTSQRPLHAYPDSEGKLPKHIRKFCWHSVDLGNRWAGITLGE